MRQTIRQHGLPDHRPNGPDPIPAHYSIALSAEDETPSTGDELWKFPVEPDWAGCWLRSAHAYLSTPGSSVTRIQLHSVLLATDLLVDRIEIDSSESFSWTSSPLPYIDETVGPLVLGDEIRVDLDNIGSGAMGLKLLVAFGPMLVRLP